MEIGHSRLLKFIVETKPKMEKHTLKIEDLSPSVIECEVPRQQKLREDKPPPSQPVQNETIEWIDLRDMIKKPVYMGLQEEVIRAPHNIRPPRTKDEVPTTSVEADKTAPEDHKPQTRIPVSKLKRVAERVLKETINASDTNAQKKKREPPEKPRRSSIPKPKDRAPIPRKNPSSDDNPLVKIENRSVKEISGETPVKKIERKALRRDKIPVLRKDQYKITKKDTHVKKTEDEDERRDENDEISCDNDNDFIKTDTDEKLDDEFDKLYEEIVDTEEISLPDEILETKVKNPEVLECKFEEIVHQYDDESVEQVKIEPVDKARYSKIPLLRRRSSHDIKVPRQFERRLSLKTGTINKPVEVRNDKVNNSIINDKEQDDQDTIIKHDPVQVPGNAYDGNDSNIEINNNDEMSRYIAVESPHPIPDYNTIPTPDAELVKVGIFGITPRDITLEENNGNISVATPEIETVKVAVIDIPAEPTEYVETEELKSEPVMQDTLKSKEKPEINEAEVNISENNDTGMPNTVEKVTNSEWNDQVESLSYEPVDNDTKPIQSPQPNILIRDPDEDLKSFELLKKANNIEERTKSRYLNKPPPNENNKNLNTKIEEDVPIIKGKVSNILKRLTSREDPSNDSNKNDVDIEESDAKENAEGIPKNKSVLSKIAIFERADPEPPNKTMPRYSKPKRTISEEIKHSPKIVEEVLQPRGAEEIDQYRIITVDIMKPVEVITNNEERITIVENLKEVSVTYDNLDDSKLNEINNKPNVMEENVSTATNDDTLNDNEDEYSEHINSHASPESIVKIETTEENRTINEFITDDMHHNEPRLPRSLESKKRIDHQHKKEKWKSTEALAEYIPVKEKIYRLKSHDDTNMKKAKSTAELDLGDAVKGKVKKMIVRMNSSELLEFKKKETVEVISAKERPRKRSVSEKIALFEVSKIVYKPGINIVWTHNTNQPSPKLRKLVLWVPGDDDNGGND